MLMLAGWVVGIFGHLSKTKGLIALGIAMIFAATIILPSLVYFS